MCLVFVVVVVLLPLLLLVYGGMVVVDDSHSSDLNRLTTRDWDHGGFDLGTRTIALGILRAVPTIARHPLPCLLCDVCAYVCECLCVRVCACDACNVSRSIRATSAHLISFLS